MQPAVALLATALQLGVLQLPSASLAASGPVKAWSNTCSVTDTDVAITSLQSGWSLADAAFVRAISAIESGFTGSYPGYSWYKNSIAGKTVVLLCEHDTVRTGCIWPTMGTWAPADWQGTVEPGEREIDVWTSCGAHAP